MTSSQTIVLVAADYGESLIAKGLMQVLREEGFTVHALLGEGKKPSPFTEETIARTVVLADTTIVFTTDDTGIEVMAAKAAMRSHGKLVLASLGYRSWKKEEFIPFRKYANTLFVMDEVEAKEAKALYPNANIIATGDPLCEELSKQTKTREEVRSALKVTSKECLVLVAGEKEVNINIPLGVAVIEALLRMSLPELYHVVFTIHPGHTPLTKQSDASDLINFYENQLGKYSPRVRVSVSMKDVPFGIGTPEMVAGADIVIGTNSMVQVQAAYQRIPAAGMPFAAAWRGVTLPPTQHGWWPYYDKWVVHPVYSLSPLELSECIGKLIHPQTIMAQQMRTAQTERLVQNNVGVAYRTMCKAVSS